MRVPTTLLCLVFLAAQGFAQIPSASSVDLGPGCNDPNAPVLTVSAPEIGGMLNISISSPVPNAIVLLAVSGPAAPLYVQYLDCTLHVDPFAMTVHHPGVTDGSGNFSISVPIANNFSQLGDVIHLQAALWSASLPQDVIGNGVAITVGLPPAPCTASDAIGSNFNGTDIDPGSTIWFNNIVKVEGRGGAAALVCFENVSISLNVDGTLLTVPAPDTYIAFDPTATLATTVFVPAVNAWFTTVPASYSGNVFLSGVALPVPNGLPGGISPVTWSGDFSTNLNGLSMKWKWAAAVYTSFPTDYNAIGVKPIDGSSMNPYPNSHHAGTPENYGSFVVGGARGGGGSNFTGSYSGTSTVACQ